MKVLVNATPLVVGGAVQVAVATIREALRDPFAREWSFAVSETVYQNLQKLADPGSREFHRFDVSPARSLSTRRRLLDLEASLKPDAVFSIFGPTYVRFRAPHLMGCAFPWVTHPSRLAIQTLNTRAWIEFLLKSMYHRTWLRKADRWVTETETSRQGMQDRVGIPTRMTAVVSNTCAQAYLEQSSRESELPAAAKKIRLLCFSAAYPHKCLDLIPDVAAALAKRRPQQAFEFVLTLPADHRTWRSIQRRSQSLQVAEHITNIGPVALADGPALYKTCDVCFLPTILETFTATYPEAMAMGVPIVTSDLDFARDICRDAAIYFQPCRAADAARAVDELLSDGARWTSLIRRGKEILATLPTPRQKYESYVSLLQEMIAGRTYEMWRPPQTETRRQAG